MFIHASAHRTVYRVRTRRRGGPHAAKKKQLVAVLSLFASHTGPETCEEPSMRRASFLLMNAVGAVSAFSCLDSAAVGVKGQRSRVGRRDIGLPSGCTRCSATAMLLSGAHAALAGVDLGCHDGRLMVAGNETDCHDGMARLSTARAMWIDGVHTVGILVACSEWADGAQSVHGRCTVRVQHPCAVTALPYTHVFTHCHTHAFAQAVHIANAFDCVDMWYADLGSHGGGIVDVPEGTVHVSMYNQCTADA